ncbi:hypothetical protein AGMMS50249_6070 [candidate division SR1 bacterium]|nr:hypothetical protein AGMMS50249_6070 [candidate division SR1 bacterium]
MKLFLLNHLRFARGKLGGFAPSPLFFLQEETVIALKIPYFTNPLRTAEKIYGLLESFEYNKGYR